MKMKVALLDKDMNYLTKIVNVFSIKYSEELQIYSFTDLNTAMNAIHKNRINLFLATEIFDIPMEELPQNCGFAYLVENGDIDSLKGKPVICKFQKVDLIYKQMLSLYSDLAANISRMRFSNQPGNVILFSSPCGGTGTSTIAAAFANACIKRNKVALYLCLDPFGSADLFYQGEGQFDLSNIIYALKSRNTNIAFKIESCVRKSIEGVFFFADAKNTLDYLELTSEDIATLLRELRICGKYEYIVLDMRFGIGEEQMAIFENAENIILVSDGTETANRKVKKAISSLHILEESNEVSVIDKMGLIYNKFGSKTGATINDLEIEMLGGVPKIENATERQLLEQLSEKTFWEKLM